MSLRLFGTDGVRGIVGELMTPEFAMRLGRAIGSHLKPGSTVAVGRDARLSGPMLSSAAVSGLLSTGVNVVRLGIAPTPAVQFYAAQHDKVDAALIITASHNPGQWNGIKYIAGDGTEASRQDEEGVERLYFSEKFRTTDWKSVGRLTSDDSACDAYLKAVLEKIDANAIRRRKFKIVVDPAGGPGTLTTPRFCEAIGATVTLLHGELDGTFPGRNPEPVDENLSKLKAKVKEVGADLGVAHDGDADRAIFVDDKGEFVSGDQSLALLAQHMLGLYPKGLVCTPVSTSSMLEEVVTKLGGRVVYTAVGSPIVGRKMRQDKAPYGGEENGGVIFADHQYCRDALMSVGRMLEFIALRGKPLSALRSELPKYFVTKLKFECPDAKKAQLAKALKAWTQKAHPKAKLDETDGFKAYFGDAWVLARPSGTEPIYRVYAESKDAKRAESLAKEFVEQSKRLLSAEEVARH
jgi:phosphomannomutase / phosphoglucomutase